MKLNSKINPFLKIITSLSLSHLQSVFLRHHPSVNICNNFPFFFKFEKLFLSADYFSPEAEYFIFRQIMFFGSISKSCPRQNSFSKCVMRFYYFISNLKKKVPSLSFRRTFSFGQKDYFFLVTHMNDESSKSN